MARGILAGSAFVRLGADLDRTGFDQFEKDHVRAQKAKDIAVKLGGDFDPSELHRYQEQLDKVQKRVAKRDAFKATLGGDYNPAAFRAYERDLNRAERDTVRSSAKMRTAFGTVWGRGGAAFAAAGGAYGVVTAVKSVTSAYQESQTSQARMQAQLKALGISYDAHAKQIDNVIQRTSKLAGLDDEDLQDAFTNLVRATGSVDKGLRLIGVSADLARAKHLDVAKAAQLVGRVANGNVTALSRYGVSIDKGASSTEALAALQAKFAGQAEAYGKTQAGASDRVQVAWENLRETLGAKLAPTFTRAANRVADFINQMQDGTGAGGKFVDQMRRIGDQLVSVGTFVKDHIGLIKLAAAAWVSYKVAALASVAASKAAGLAALAGGRSAAGAGAAGAAGSAAARGAGAAGAVGTGALGGPIGIGIATAAFAALEYAQNKVAARSRDVATGFELAGKAAKEMVDKGDPHGIAVLRASIDSWGKSVGATGGEIHRLKDILGDFQKAAERNVGGVGKALDKAADHFADFRKTASNNLHGIHTATADNMHFIERTLGTESEAGRKALVGNFKLAEQAVRDAMRDGKVTTRDGLGEIRRLMKQELAVYGIKGQQATDYLRSSGHGSGNESRGGGHAGGGWIGVPGMVGTDTVPAMLAPGEAVLNRHQQAVIEGMLGDGFLDNLFARVQTPHYFASGGRVQGAVASLGSRLSNMFGLSVTSTTGGTHAPGSYHYQGLAEDLGGSEAAMSKASAYLMSSGIYRSLLEGIHKPGLSVKNGNTVPSSFWGGVWDQHANHIHIALRALGAAGGGAFGSIKAPTISGGGALGAVVQRALNAAAGGANDRLGSILGSLGGGDLSDTPVRGGKTSAGGKYNKAQLAALWRRAGGAGNVANLMAAIALAESGGNPSIVNSIGATGLWQIHPGGRQYLNPLTNAKTAVSKYSTQGLSAWEAYTNGSYRQYLSRGGRVLRFASGGRVPTVTGGSAQRTTGGGTTLRIRGLKDLQASRVSDFDALTSAIEGDRKRYEQADRRYNQSDEVFVDPVTGALNQDAIEKRAGELSRLMAIRRRILIRLEKALEIARRVVATYDTMLGRLSRSLKYASKKDRSGISAQIDKYQGERETWRSTASDLGFDVGDAKLDIGDLEKEGAELRGTVADVPSVSDTPDFGSDSTGGDSGSGGTEPDADAQAQISQAQQIAESFRANLTAANQVISAFSSTGDLGTGGSNAFNAVANGAQPVGAQYSSQFLGGAPTINTDTAPVVNYNFNMPGAPNVLRAIGDAATAGQSLQSSVGASVTKLGI